MAFNVLTGSVSSVSTILASGSFTGSFGGNGAELENVKQFELYGVQTSGRIVLFKDVGGNTALEADTDLFYDTTTDALSTPSLTASNGISTTTVSGSGGTEIGTYLSASGQIHFPNIASGSIAGNGSFLGLNTAGNLVLTSSTVIANDGDNRLTTANGAGGLVGEANLTFDGSVLSIQSGLILKRRQITSTITVASTDYFIGISASSNININLPDASTLANGQTFIFKDEAGSANSHTIEIKTTSPQTIDGVLTVQLESPFAAVNVYTNGADKYFIY
jgi:hypothetical protein